MNLGNEMPFNHENEFWFTRQILVRSNPIPIDRIDLWQELPRFSNGYAQDISNYNRAARNFIPVEQGVQMGVYQNAGHYVNYSSNLGENGMINHIPGNLAGWDHSASANLLVMQNGFSGATANAPADCFEMQNTFSSATANAPADYFKRRRAIMENISALRNANCSNIINRTPYTNLGPVFHSHDQDLYFQASNCMNPNLHSQVGDWRQVNSACMLLENQTRCFDTNVPSSSTVILQDQMPHCSRPQATFQPVENCVNVGCKFFEDGFYVPYDLNLTPTEVYADSAFQRIEVQRENIESGHLSRREKGKNVMTCTSNHVRIEQNCDELLQNLVDSSSAVVSNLVEDKGGSEGETEQLIDLNKTPPQKTPKRRKHRPKVVVEGKLKKVRKPITKKEEKPAGKRKYVHRKEPVIEEVEKTRESKNTVPEIAVKSCRRGLNFNSEITGDERQGQAFGQQQNSELGTKHDNCRTNSIMLKSQQNVPPEGSAELEAMYGSPLLMSQMLADYISMPNRQEAASFSPIHNLHMQNSAVVLRNRDTRNADLMKQNIEAEGIGNIVLQARKFCENQDGDRQLMVRNSQLTPQVASSPCEIRGLKREHRQTFKQLKPNATDLPDGSRTVKKKKTENGLHSNVNANRFTSAKNQVISNTHFARGNIINVEEDFNDQYIPELEPCFEKKRMAQAKSLTTQAHNLASQSTTEKCNFVPSTPKDTGVPEKVPRSKTPCTKVSEQKQNTESSKKGRPKKEKNQSTNDNQQSLARTQVKPSNPTDYISVDEIIDKMNALNLYGLEQQVLVPYKSDGTIVPYAEVEFIKKRKPRPKVDLDPETNRIWNLLMGNEASVGLDEDEGKEKKWEEEREVFRGRADSFIARMHLVQGDRRFSKWKGSVVDSVIGVFLTQNVSDHLSSSAFMCLAARFPKKPTNNRTHTTNIWVEENEVCILNTCDSIDWITDESTLPLLGKSTEHRRRSENAESHSFEETPSSQDSKNSSIIHGSGRIKSSTPKKVKGSTSQPQMINSNSFEEFYNRMNGSPLLLHKGSQDRGIDYLGSSSRSTANLINFGNLKPQTELDTSRIAVRETNSLPRALQGFETYGEECISSCTQFSEENYRNCTLHIPDAPKVSEKLFDGERTAAANNQTLIHPENKTFDQNPMGQTHSYDKKKENIITKSSTSKKSRAEGEKNAVDWDSLRKDVLSSSMMRERSEDTMDSMNYEALRRADVKEISATIKERGMNNMLAERIKDFLDRVVRDHRSIDLEWLRDVPPEKAKDYLLSIQGVGLKSTECVRLLTLHHLSFPVDTNVGRIVVRLGWVPLQPLPESLQLHLLEMYPLLETIQKYLWPRLCKLDQRTLYELHYQMITFGKVFCTKSKPNCNACPMRGECRHFASAFASARLALPGPEEKSIVSSVAPVASERNPIMATNSSPLCLPVSNRLKEVLTFTNKSEPIIEESATPEPEYNEIQETDFEDAFYEDPDEIPTIKLNIEEFAMNLQNYMQENTKLKEGDLSKALVALNPQSASIPAPRLKNISRLRTEHYVYELPDSHPLLNGMDKREPDDPSPYLLAIWTPGETASSIEPPEQGCKSEIPGKLCNDKTCFSCNSKREAKSQTVRGTILIPCRTAMRGSFPLNGTYFQVNEVFADHESSVNPIDVPREWIWELERRVVYFGTSVTTIFKGLTTEGIQFCFWRGFVCVRGFDHKTRAPKPLMARLHFPASKLARSRNGN